jgi:hypothetical protein
LERRCSGLAPSGERDQAANDLLFRYLSLCHVDAQGDYLMHFARKRRWIPVPVQHAPTCLHCSGADAFLYARGDRVVAFVLPANMMTGVEHMPADASVATLPSHVSAISAEAAVAYVPPLPALRARHITESSSFSWATPWRKVF